MDKARVYTRKARSGEWNYGGAKWKLSRTKIDLFKECPRCFYLDNKLGISRPRGPAFTLNVAVDELLKKEFDFHRRRKSRHPLMEKYGIDALPFDHAGLAGWRENFVGIQYRHEPTGFLVSGAVDDVWADRRGELLVVDYKATAKDGRIETLDDSGWSGQYKRQMEVYQWLLRRNGFPVSDTGYFVYVNGRKDREAFDGKLEFDVTLISHTGKDGWVEPTLLEIKKCLDGSLPPAAAGCEFCGYCLSRAEAARPAPSPQGPGAAAAQKPRTRQAKDRSREKNESAEEKKATLF